MKERYFAKPRVVISKCIEFSPCRWNGSVISSPVVKKFIGSFSFLLVCPESEIGLGIPRKPVRLIDKKGDIRMIQHETEADFTSEMADFSDNFLSSLKKIDGFILKDRSPSCGIKDVKYYPPGEKKQPISSKGSGLFGEKAVSKFGSLAIETEGRLNDAAIRDHFLTKLYALSYFREISAKPAMGKLVEYHSENKYLFMAYNQSILRYLGKITANPGKDSVESTFQKYAEKLPHVFSRQMRKGSVVNVLQHALGYFSDKLTSREKKYFLLTLDKFTQNRSALSECRSLLMSWIVRFEEEYLLRQTFFSPYPEELI
ncbi:DUF1722 domain-containing protein [candidate division WOR-3 bacterium]|nr:DUF1722 domain-containing protein [candidate division WOR-3 bacterium]